MSHPLSHHFLPKVGVLHLCKGYALIDILTIPICMVMVASPAMEHRSA